MITVTQFKEWFTRDFPYLPEYEEDKIYFIGDIVFVAPNFYQSLKDNNTDDVSVTASWKPIKESVDSYIGDSDIEKAINEADLSFNKELFDDCESRSLALMYLTAFYLVVDIKNGCAGISSNAYASFVSNKSVGNVSEGYGFPAWVANNPMYSIYLDNGYGKKYLSFIIPRINGWFYLSEGATTRAV